MTKNLFIIFLAMSSVYVNSDHYALTDLEEFVQTESVLVRTLNSYIHAEEEKLSLLKKYAQTYQQHHEQAAKQTYVANPINAYLLVKRLTVDWKQVEHQINTSIGQDFLVNFLRNREPLKFPSEEDLYGVAAALSWLQDIYHLTTSSLAKGEINGVKYSSELSAADCFDLGLKNYYNRDFYHTILWLIEADARLGKQQNETITKSDVLEYMAHCTFMMGNTDLALEVTNDLLELVPTHPRALINKVYYEREISNRSSVRKKGDDGVENARQNAEPPYDQEKQLFEQLCGGNLTTPPDITMKLKCRYLDNGNPFLKMAPFKMEEAYLEPRVVIFHDVMSDDEIATIKRMARPRFTRALLTNPWTEKLETSHYRICKVAWLREKEHKHISDVARRVGDMTGLSMETAEYLQVVNYGIGGYYGPHFDFAKKGEKLNFNNVTIGNRIATVLFYMSDVAQGGATVFPHLKIAVWPKKGTAVFWCNLHTSGDGHVNTRHAACPVLAGSKWVSNKWIHELGQEFRRPCGLTRPPSELTA